MKRIWVTVLLALCLAFSVGTAAAQELPVHRPSYTLVIVWQGYRAGAMTTVAGYTSAETCMASARYMREHAAVDTYCLLVQ